MHRRAAFESVLGIVAAFLFLPFAYAQLPPHLERCLPYPPPGAETAESLGLKIAFDAIRFENNSQPSEHVQRLLIRAIRSHSFKEYPGWIDELAEVGLRGALQEHGFFRADVSAKAKILSTDAKYEHVSLTVRADPGPQYWLGSVQFRSADPDVPLVFPPEQLRKLVPLRDGGIFDVSKLREGFDALKKLYGSSGWIDFTPTPNFDIDDAAKRINLTLELDQMKQYRVGKIDVWGDNPAAEKILRATFKAGEPLNASDLGEFFVVNKSILPLGASAQYDVELKKNVRNGVVNLRFDFRTCPAFWE